MSSLAAPSKFPPAEGSQPVFIVGAGLSALAAAWRLRESGVPVVLFERRDRVGGQLLTVKQDGYIMEAGTTILPGSYSRLMQLVSDVGMSDELLPANSLLAFARDGELNLLRSDHLVLDAMRTKLLSTRSKAHVAKIGFDGLRMRNVLDYEDLSVAGAFDHETPAAYCQRRGIPREVFDYLVDPICRGGAGTPGDVISNVEFFFLMQKVLGTKLFAFRDGYSSLVERLADAFDVRLGATVDEIVETPDGVEVSWSDSTGSHTETGRAAVVSTMANEVPDMLPQLSPERGAFMRDRLNYTSCISVNIALSSPPDVPASFVMVPRPVSEGLFAIILEHNKCAGRAAAGKGLATLFTVNEWARRHMDLADEALVDLVLAEAEKVIPGLSNHIEFTRVNRWFPVLVYSHPGLYRELGVFHASRPRLSRIALAGSYNSSGNVETATVAGERAAREVLETLRAKDGRLTTV